VISVNHSEIVSFIWGVADLIREPINPEANTRLFGQEVNTEKFAVCKSDLFMKSFDARDAGSGESEIRRFVLENDWLEALIAVPEQLFYNT
jgi:type I restriction-modification system DNA methylase subunit